MANNYIGELIREARIGRAMTFGDLARACGAAMAKQTSRISQRLVLFEREGVRDRNLLHRVISALDLDPHVVIELLDRQRDEELAEWNAWADESVPIELHMRPFAGVWIKLQLPEEIATDELRAIDYARKMTVNRDDLRIVVVADRRRSLTIAGGEVVATMHAKPNLGLQPYLLIGGRRVVFEAPLKT
jgi:alkylated DNA nucleotide flippase Atl1